LLTATGTAYGGGGYASDATVLPKDEPANGLQFLQGECLGIFNEMMKSPGRMDTKGCVLLILLTPYSP